MKLIITLALPLVLFAKAPKNLIFIVGDGMGLASVTAARIYLKGSEGQLNIEKFKTIGLSKTYSTDNFTTDSAAGATAFATGKKSYNGSISMDTNIKPLRTIFDVARENKKSTGIVTTTSVTHATPACFYAHAKKRNEEKFIASQVKDSGLEFLLGGGSKFFKSKRKELKEAGWEIIGTKSELDLVNKEKPVLGLFAKNHLKYSIKNKKGPELIDLVKVGLKRLNKNKNGYMFLIEAGRIDHAGHANLAKEQFGEMRSLDKVIGYLLNEVDLKETLIVLTADHETGGLAISGYGDLKKVQGDYFLNKKSSYGGNPFISWATGPAAMTDPNHKAAYPLVQANHTAIDVPIYSIGNGHEKLGGFMLNNEITPKILKHMELEL